MKILKYFIFFVLFIFCSLFVYFIKCQLDICLIQDFPLDKYPPLSLLQNRNPHHIVFAPRINVDLLPNRFIFLSNADLWENLWVEEGGMVTLSDDLKGNNNGSSLLITSRSSNNWSLSHKKMFQVNPGEIYGFSGSIKILGKGTVGAMSVVLYDVNMNIKQWDYAVEYVTGADNWQKVNREFTVPVGVKYIRFRLSGTGIGKIWYNEIQFKKISLPLS